MKRKVTVKVGGDTIQLEIDATAYVKWENRAAAIGKTPAECISLFLTKEVQRTR